MLHETFICLYFSSRWVSKRFTNLNGRVSYISIYPVKDTIRHVSVNYEFTQLKQLSVIRGMGFIETDSVNKSHRVIPKDLEDMDIKIQRKR